MDTHLSNLHVTSSVTVQNVLDVPALEVLAKGVGLVRDEARQYTDETSRDYANYAEGVAAALQWLTGNGVVGDKLTSLLRDGATQARFAEDPEIKALRRALGRD